jgi:hypothetical protein
MRFGDDASRSIFTGDNPRFRRSSGERILRPNDGVDDFSGDVKLTLLLSFLLFPFVAYSPPPPAFFPASAASAGAYSLRQIARCVSTKSIRVRQKASSFFSTLPRFRFHTMLYEFADSSRKI